MLMQASPSPTMFVLHRMFRKPENRCLSVSLVLPEVQECLVRKKPNEPCPHLGFRHIKSCLMHQGSSKPALLDERKTGSSAKMIPEDRRHLAEWVGLDDKAWRLEGSLVEVQYEAWLLIASPACSAHLTSLPHPLESPVF